MQATLLKIIASIAGWTALYQQVYACFACFDPFQWGSAPVSVKGFTGFSALHRIRVLNSHQTSHI